MTDWRDYGDCPECGAGATFKCRSKVQRQTSNGSRFLAKPHKTRGLVTSWEDLPTWVKAKES